MSAEVDELRSKVAEVEDELTDAQWALEDAEERVDWARQDLADVEDELVQAEEAEEDSE